MRPLHSIRRVCLLSLLLTTAALHSQQTLRSVRAIRALSPQTAAQHQPVRLHGVVSTVSGWKNSFFFLDGTAGISVNQRTSQPAPAPGSRVTLVGVTGPGSFAPVVETTSVLVEGSAPMPRAPLRTAEELMGGRQDGQWVRVRGTVVSMQIRPVFSHDMLTLNLDIGSGLVANVRIREFDRAHLPSLIGAFVQVEGVCATLFNARRQFVGVRLYLSSPQNISTLRPPPKDPFDRPLRPLDSLLQFDQASAMHDLVRVGGIVTWQAAGAFYLQHDDSSLLIDWKDGEPPVLGTRVEAVGYPAIGHGSTHLRASFVRTVDRHPDNAILPRPVRPSGVIVMHDGFLSNPDEGLLVQVDAVLLDSFVGASQTTLLMKGDGTVFTVRVASNSSIVSAPGALLRITGICTIDYDDYSNEPAAFYIKTRSQNNITVLHAAPWWNAVHTLRVVMALCFAIAMLLSVVLLFKQARLRSLATTDALTGLANRRTLLRYIDRSRRTLRARQKLLLLFIDVDHFKQINDCYGHQQGDTTLKQVAGLLRETFPDSRVLARIGGDEFVVVVEGSTRQACEARLSLALERSRESWGSAIPVALSTGILECGRDDQDLSVEDLLGRADALMYERKRAATTHTTTPASLQHLEPALTASPAH